MAAVFAGGGRAAVGDSEGWSGRVVYGGSIARTSTRAGSSSGAWNSGAAQRRRSGDAGGDRGARRDARGMRRGRMQCLQHTRATTIARQQGKQPPISRREMQWPAAGVRDVVGGNGGGREAVQLGEEEGTWKAVHDRRCFGATRQAAQGAADSDWSLDWDWLDPY